MQQTMPLDPRLVAVMARDRSADGNFVYAVRSTGVFCRPSCASRRPLREHIAFFDTAAEAKRAGYRACLRCQPENASLGNDMVREVCRYIDSQGDQPPRLRELAARFGFSPHYLARSFKAAVGMTPRAYAAFGRVERLKGRLQSGESVTDALYNAGFGSSSRLYERGSQLLGMTPNDYRRGGNGAAIRYTIVPSRLGRLLIASSHRGICAVKLGDNDKKLTSLLEREYSAASIRRDDKALQTTSQRVIANVERGESLRGMPVDVAATAFTRKVWQALSEIPYGQTRTYGQIAAAIGHPGAARAVGRACATNNVALVIPCHRVVPSSGESGGYRWGAKRKRLLLQHESDVASRRSGSDQKAPV